MKTRKQTTQIVVSVLALAGLAVFSLFALAGNLEPNAPPGPTMHTLDEIYDLYSSMVPPGLEVPGIPKPDAAYIKFDGVDGQSQDLDHKGWSDLISFGQSIEQAASIVMGANDVNVGDIVVTKVMDKATPKLAQAMCTGQVFPTVDIHVTGSYTDAGRVTYYAYAMKNAIITSYNIRGSLLGEGLPMEEVSLNFEEIKWTYTECDANGIPLGDVMYTWTDPDATPSD